VELTSVSDDGMPLTRPCGDEDSGGDDVSSFCSDPSWVDSGAVGAVTASFVWLRLVAQASRAVADG
jgi:hypothetical protein